MDKANCITGQSTLLFTSLFKAHATLVFHFVVQIKKLSLSLNKIGNSGAKVFATCLWNIDELDELDLRNCYITECEELCNAIQSLKRPVSFNLVSRHTVLKFVWYARCVRWFAVNAKSFCGKYFPVQCKFYSIWSNSCVKMLFHEPESRNCTTHVCCRLTSCIYEWKVSQCW